MNSQLSSDQYYIVSVMHTQRRHHYITVWRSDDRGYAWPLSWAGKYSGARVRGNLGYYNSGSNLAVRCEVLDALAVPPTKGRIDNDAGPVVPNTKTSWGAILDAVIEPPKFIPRPQYRGAPRVAA